jgi:hypothetical protein
VLDRVYRAVAWQRVDQIRYDIIYLRSLSYRVPFKPTDPPLDIPHIRIMQLLTAELTFITFYIGEICKIFDTFQL